MANTTKFQTKNGLLTQTVDFRSPTGVNTMQVAMLDSGMLSVTGVSGQLFSIVDSLSGTIFSVNDISGVPSIEVDDTGVIRLAQFAGNVLVGTAANNAVDKLQINGTVSAIAYKSTVATGTAPFTVASTTRIANLNAATAGIADTVTTNANLAGDVTSVGNVTTLSAAVAGLFVSKSGGTMTGNLNFSGSSSIGIGKVPDAGISFDLLGQAQIASAGDGGLLIYKYTALSPSSRTWRLCNDVVAYGDFRLQVSTTQTGNTFSDVLAVDGTTKNVLSGSGAIGYGVGAGSTVTQSTSRGTTVTINKPSGSIAMVSAAGSATPLVFLLNNTFISPNDTMSFSITGATNSYAVFAVAMGSGSANISFYSLAGTAVDSPTFKFNIHKGSAS